MSLKISLKPHEKIILGGAVVTNGPTACQFHVENKVPILRQDSILSERDATTPCKRVYFVVQLMYLGGGMTQETSQAYWDLVKDIVAAAPSTNNLISQMSESLLANQYYQALKTAKKLIQYEKELVAHVSEHT